MYLTVVLNPLHRESRRELSSCKKKDVFRAMQIIACTQST